MAAMALPIRELELSVRVGTEKARAEAECVVFYSEARAIEPVRMTVRFGIAALFLKFLLGHLFRRQRSLIRAIQSVDFSQCSNEELLKVAERLECIPEKGWPVIEKLHTVGPRTQKLLGDVVSDLAEQLNHMESIASSLRSATNPEVSLLIASAVDRMAASVGR